MRQQNTKYLYWLKPRLVSSNYCAFSTFQMNKIERNFLDTGKAKERNGIILFSKTDALDFIRQCEKDSIDILGIDGFYLKGDNIQPSSENSIDFSSGNSKTVTDVYNQSLDFISKRENELFYEIICS